MVMYILALLPFDEAIWEDLSEVLQCGQDGPVEQTFKVFRELTETFLFHWYFHEPGKSCHVCRAGKKEEAASWEFLAEGFKVQYT